MEEENTFEEGSGSVEGERMGVSQSPVKIVIEDQVDFYDALRAVIEGKKITKVEWDNKEYYGVLDDTFLKLHKPDGKLHSWILSDGDINGTDYVIIN